MNIVNIKECDALYITQITEWLWEEWGQPNNYNFWRSWIKSSLLSDNVPQTFAAIEDKNIVGTVSLWRCDLQSRQDISPWLGGLYVSKSYRNRGIGSALQEHAFKVAHNLNYKEIYMFTELNNYFERFGWQYVEDIPNENGNMVKLYRRDL